MTQPLRARQYLASFADPARHVHPLALDAPAVCQLFRQFVARVHRTQLAAALHYGVGEGHLARIMAGEKIPNGDMLADLGWRRLRLFVPSRSDCERLPRAASEWAWGRSAAAACTAIDNLEAMGVLVTGFEVRDGAEPVISAAHSPALDALGGRCLGGDFRNGQAGEWWIAEYAGCLVRWHVAHAAPAVHGMEAA